MQYFELDENEEKELGQIETFLSEGKLKSISKISEQKASLQEAAKRTLNKTKNINIRISERDLTKLKAKAVEEGIPYQSLATSILHKAVR